MFFGMANILSPWSSTATSVVITWKSHAPYEVPQLQEVMLPITLLLWQVCKIQRPPKQSRHSERISWSVLFHCWSNSSVSGQFPNHSVHWLEAVNPKVYGAQKCRVTPISIDIQESAVVSIDIQESAVVNNDATWIPVLPNWSLRDWCYSFL